MTPKSDAVDPVDGTGTEGPRAPKDSVLSLPVARLPLEWLIAKAKTILEQSDSGALAYGYWPEIRRAFMKAERELAACLGAPQKAQTPPDYCRRCDHTHLVGTPCWFAPVLPPSQE